ncbi:MAG: Uma2 family endonuclease [Gordonia amarae]
MTAMPTEVLGLPRGRALTRSDLAAMPDDGHRYELIDGVLIVSPAPKIRHQIVAGELTARMRAVCPPNARVLFAPVDVVLAEDTVIQPDILLAPRGDFTETDLPGPPLLAIEVLSPSTKGIDLLLKKDRLQRAGCRYYWVIDPDQPSIAAFALRNGVFELCGQASGSETFTATEPIAISFAPDDLVD